MLAPNRRSLYVEALVPPPGFELVDAIATTYSVDLDTLLGVPVHLALSEQELPIDMDAGALAWLAALRRMTGRMTVFTECGRASPPASPHVLYSLLEPILVEVRSEGASFHAKVWVLRFDAPDGTRRLRLIVPTRNLTGDRSWDACLVLDGTVSGGPKALNAPLAKLLTALPGLALHALSVATQERLASVVEDLRRTEWEAPPGWELVAFHIHGVGKSPFPIEGRSDELLVVSPFVSVKALEALAATTKRARALVSRPEELAKMPANALALFESHLVLDENAGADPDGEGELENRLRGLHAKVYVATTRSTTDLWVGSANATTPGLVDRRNVEILVQLRTKGPRVRPIDDFLGDEGMGPLLDTFEPGAEPEPESDDELRVEAAREALSAALLHVRATRSAEDGLWRGVLEMGGSIDFPDQVDACAWPVSMARTAAVNVRSLADGASVPLAPGDSASLTGLVAFEVRVSEASARFVRNLPVLDMPPEREGDLLRSIIGSRDRFLALMMALFGDAKSALARGTGADGSPSSGSNPFATSDGSGLLEHLVRACATDRARLHEAVALVAALRKSTEGAVLVPEGFPELLALLEGELA